MRSLFLPRVQITAALLLACVSLALSSASAATITVTNTNDSGAGSLRDAIASATSGDTVDFNLAACPCTITLTSAELLISQKSLIIRGPGANQLTISGNNARRVFRITAMSPRLVTISGVTITNGTTAANGGGINLEVGTLTLVSSVVTNNTAPTGGVATGAGGGIMAERDTRLNVIDSVISNNTSARAGGGISTSTSGTGGQLTVARTTVSGNSATLTGGGGIYISPVSSLSMTSSIVTNNTLLGNGFSGAGIYNQGAASLHGGSIDANNASGTGASGGGISNTGSLSLTGVRVANNTAFGGASLGGGIMNTGSLAIEQSTISTNSGGGIVNSATLTLANSTISGNTFTGSSGVGAGINNLNNGTTTLTGCTIAFNAATQRGGGVANGTSNATVNSRNTIIALNTAPTGGPAPGLNVFGTFVSQGYNLIGSTTASENSGFTNGINNDIVGGAGPAAIDPLLDPLANNGGPTFTHALQANSPAIDAGSGFWVVTDQRGRDRFNDIPAMPTPPGGDGSDIGAFEYFGAAPPLQLINAVSRKTHAAAGVFDVNLPATGAVGVECRSESVPGNHEVVFNFAGPVTFNSASVSAGVGSVMATSGSGTSSIVVDLTGVTNAQTITVALTGVSNGVDLANFSAPMGILLGDTGGSGSVSSSDITQAKAQSGTPITSTSFRSDVNVSGAINASDISLVKTSSGTQLP